MYRSCLSIPLLLVAGCMEGQKPSPAVRLGRATEAKPLPPAEQVPLPGPKVEAKVPEPKKSLYDRLGGVDAITKVVDDFVANVVADDNLKDEHKKPFKEGAVGALKKKLIDQVGEATGGPQKYTGKSMKEAHAGLKITDKDFDALMDDLSKALDTNKVARADKDDLMNMLEKMRKDVVEVKADK